MPRPSNDSSNIGLLPYRSLRLPNKGAKTNCMIAYAKAIQPLYLEASLISPWINCSIKAGTTGMINPIPVTSISKVIKIKLIAAERFAAI